MFDAICGNCGNSCKIPFQPRGDKPVFCSNCSEKNSNRPLLSQSQPQAPSYNHQFEQLNMKLDSILKLLANEKTQPEAEVKEVKKKTKKAKKTP